MKPGLLYLVPAPLGEGDVSGVIPEKIKAVISKLDTFIAENPKTARHYLKQLGVSLPLQQIHFLALNEHTPAEQLESLLQPLLAGKDVGLMSEAGCPAVADPGADLIRLAHARNIRVVPLVGPSSLLLALMASGLNGQCFAFLGYLPRNKGERAAKIREIEKDSRSRRQTQIFIEAPYRNQQLLLDILDACDQDTLLCLATELTLATEAIKTMTIGAWRKDAPDINKRPTVFLLAAS